MSVTISIPVLASNGAGAAVDTSGMAASKTIIVGGAFNATVTIEYSTAPAGNLWAPIQSFQGPGRAVVDLATRRLRAVTSSYVSGTPNADVAAPISQPSFVHLTGTPVDILSFPEFKTVVVDGPCNVEISDDGTVFSQVFSFPNAGAQSAPFTAKLARVTNGATCWLGGADLGSEVPGNGILLQATGIFQPDSGAGLVNVISSSGQFDSPGSYIGVGVYSIDLESIPGVTSASQVIPFAVPNRTAGTEISVAGLFSIDHGVIDVRVFDAAGVPVDSVFYLHVNLLA